MGEFSQIMQIVAEQIKSASPQMEVVNAFPNAPRNNPQKENLADSKSLLAANWF